MNRLEIRRNTIVALPLLLATACSSSSGSSPAVGGGGDSGEQEDSGPTTALDSGTQTETSSPYDAGAPGNDASGAVPVFVSNTPGATVQDDGNPPTPELVLISLNFLQQASGGMFYQQWLGEVMNVGATPACQIELQLNYQGAGGTILVTPPQTFVDGPPWVLPGGDNLSMGCLATGQIGSFYTNAFANAETSLAGVTTITVAFQPHTYPTAIADPDAPIITSSPEPYIGAYALTGTMVGGAAAINNIELHGYPRDATGLVLAQLSATDLGELDPGVSFAFTTDTVATAFTQFRQFPSYIEGTSTMAIVRSGAEDEARRMATVEEAVRRAARDARLRTASAGNAP